MIVWEEGVNNLLSAALLLTVVLLTVVLLGLVPRSDSGQHCCGSDWSSPACTALFSAQHPPTSSAEGRHSSKLSYYIHRYFCISTEHCRI